MYIVINKNVSAIKKYQYYFILHIFYVCDVVGCCTFSILKWRLCLYDVVFGGSVGRSVLIPGQIYYRVSVTFIISFNLQPYVCCRLVIFWSFCTRYLYENDINFFIINLIFEVTKYRNYPCNKNGHKIDY